MFKTQNDLKTHRVLILIQFTKKKVSRHTHISCHFSVQMSKLNLNKNNKNHLITK